MMEYDYGVPGDILYISCSNGTSTDERHPSLTGKDVW